MDPNACLDRLLLAIYSRDADALRESADDLATWLEKGGAFPLIDGAIATLEGL